MATQKPPLRSGAKRVSSPAPQSAFPRPFTTVDVVIFTVRSDALEVLVGDEHWPLPKYREMLFPV